jgi:hypothetical protein
MEDVQAVYAKVASCHPLQCQMKANSHIPRRAPAVLAPFRSESDISIPRHSTAGARHGHGMCQLTWAVERRSASSGCYAFTKVVNQRAAAFWNVFVLMTMETAIIRNMN